MFASITRYTCATIECQQVSAEAIGSRLTLNKPLTMIKHMRQLI